MRKCHVFYSLIIFLFLQAQFVHAASLRVSPEWLKSHLQDENVVILDTRPSTEYQFDHIEGALNFSDSLTYQQKSKGGRIVEPDIMQALLRERGIDKHKTVIIYDAGQLIDAARVFWALEVYGIPNVKILEPGYGAWKASNLPTSDVVPTVDKSKYVASIIHGRIASKFSTQLATKNPQQIVIDARSVESFQGKKSSAKRFGHIPTAINMPVTNNIKNEGGVKVVKSIAELEKIYAQLPKDKKIITYCEIGKISSTNYFALRELGYDVANYDASWREWGNDLSLPIEK